jgi:hypothetical protein
MADWPPEHPAPCGGWKETLLKATTFGDLHQHYDPTAEKVPVRHNVTKVFNPNCTPECCDRAEVTDCGDDCCPPVSGCPPACPDGQPATIPATPRDSCTDPVTGNGTLFPGCPDGAPCGPEPATLGLKYVNGDCRTAVFPPVPCGAGETRFGDNCYTGEDMDTVTNLTTCRIIGFKNVIAVKQWHGALPFGVDCTVAEVFAPNSCAGPPLDDHAEPTGDCPGATCFSKPYTPNNGATKKYLSTAMGITISHYDGGASESPIYKTVYTYSGTNHVDRYTGKVTRAATASLVREDGVWPNGDIYPGATLDAPAMPKIVELLDRCSSAVSQPVVTICDINGEQYGPGTITITRTGDSQITLHFEGDAVNQTGVFIPNTPECPSSGAGVYVWEPDDTLVFADCPGATIVVPVIHMRVVADVTLTLSEPYTGADVMSDLKALLATWDLTDHALYPPRIDAITNGGPLVAYNERLQVEISALDSIDPTAYPDGWTDTSPPQYLTRAEGSVVGGPLPRGCEPYLDIYHKQWDLSDADNPDATFGYFAPKRYGMRSDAAPFHIPHATQWTDELHHLSLPHGPFVYCQTGGTLVGARLFYPHFHGAQNKQSEAPGGVWMSKWAEVLMFEKPPHNYQRPCGQYDAAAVDLSTVDCDADDPLADALPRWPDTKCDCDDDTLIGQVTAATNATPIVLTLDRAHGKSDGDVINVCGVKGCTAANGKRTVIVVGDDTLQLFDAEDPETPIAGNGEYSGDGNVTENVSGNERYWNDKWAKGNFVFKQWSYNFRDWWESYRCILQAYNRTKDNAARAANDTGDGGNCENGEGDQCCPACPGLTAPDPVRFKVVDEALTHQCDETDAGCTTMDTGQIMEEGNERNGGSKWLQNVTCNQYCVEHQPCAPCMAYVVPPSEIPEDEDPSDKWIAMPYCGGSGDPNQLDWLYGTLWIGRVEQWMTDPLWKPYGNGHELLKCGKVGGPDGADCNRIVEDNGTCCPPCGGDGSYTEASSGQIVCVFPQRPYEEAECQKPDGSPAFPADARVLGCKDYVANLNLGSPVVNGQDAAPGIPECGSPYNYVLKWFPSVTPFGDVELDTYCFDYNGTEVPAPCGGSGNGHYILQAIGPGELTACLPWTPWLWLLNQQACVRTDGIYASDYRRNGTVAE